MNARGAHSAGVFALGAPPQRKRRAMLITDKEKMSRTRLSLATSDLAPHRLKTFRAAARRRAAG
jgi:hypothetical protein